MYNINRLMGMGREFEKKFQFRDALNIYLYLADGDPSLDAGWTGERIAICYEHLGDLHSAKYWYGRAVEENPTVRTESIRARERLTSVGIDYLFPNE